MKPIIKEVLRNVKFETEDWRFWILRFFMAQADCFLLECEGDIEDIYDHPVFFHSDSENEEAVEEVFDEAEHKRVHKLLKSCTSDDYIRQVLFLFYLLYRRGSNVMDSMFNSMYNNGKQLSENEHLRAECERHHEKWDVICINFNASRAARNKLIEEPEGDFEPDEEWYIENSDNPITKITIKWHNNKTTYNFNYDRMDLARSSMSKRDNPHYDIFKMMLNNDMYLELKSGDLYEEVKRIVLDVLRSLKFFTDLGTFGDKGKTIHRRIARLLFPIYTFLTKNHSKLSSPYDPAKIAIELIGLSMLEEESIRIYMGKGVAEHEKVNINLQYI